MSNIISQNIQSIPYFSKHKNDYLQKLTPLIDKKLNMFESSIIQPIKNQQFLTLQQQNGITELGRKCLFNKECIKGAKCLFNVCACPPKTIANNYGYCVSENLDNIIKQYSSNEKKLEKKYSRDISQTSENIYLNKYLTNNKNFQSKNLNKKNKYKNVIKGNECN